MGLEREQVLSEERVLPGVRFAVDAYVNFARRASWQEAASSSLTELFAPQIHQSRLDGWPRHYPWIEAAGYEYFRSRLAQARRDVEHGLRITLEHYRTREAQERMLDILQFKLDVLWSMLDAMSMAYELERPPYHTVTRERVWHRAGIMSLPSLDSVPMLRRGFRFQFEPAQDCHVLLYPEGMVKLNDSAGEILKLVDGRRDVAAIVAAARAFPRSPRHRRRHPGVPRGGPCAILDRAAVKAWGRRSGCWPS